MPGLTIDDNVNAEMGYMPTAEEVPGDILEEPKSRFSLPDNEMIKKVFASETGTGAIGDYIEHPLNFNKSRSMAQILRGLTGIIGNLNLAVVDVFVGVLNFSKERKAGVVSEHNAYPNV